MKDIIELIEKNELVRSAFAVVVGALIYNIFKILIRCLVKGGRTSFEKKKRKTIIKLAENIFKYVLIVVVVCYILEAYGIDTKSLVAGIGVAGVVLGLALQDFLKDLISGLSIILDNYFIIGDIVEYDGFTGEVVEFGLKSTKIRAFNGDTLSLANRNIDKIKNLSQKSSNLFLTIPTAYEEKEEVVKKVLEDSIKKIIKETEADEESTYLGIENFSSSSIDYIIKIHCPNEKRWAVKRKALIIIKNEYDKNNIKIPYTQVEVHNAK